MRQQYLKEAIELFDDNDQRSFNELYEGKEDLFQNVDDLISPKMRKLFEATYQTGNIQQKRLREAEVQYGGANGYQELNNTNDGVPEGHNRGSNPSGSDPQVRQSTPNHSGNSPLPESMKSAFNKIFESANIPGGYNFSGDEGSPKGDGLPNEINGRPLGGGAASSITQGQGRGISGNAQLGHEPLKGDSYKA